MIILFAALFLLTGCESESSSSSAIEAELGEGSIEGYMSLDAEGNYTFTEEKGDYPVDQAIVKIDGSIYETNEEGYFRADNLRAGRDYGIDVIVGENDYIWSGKVSVQKDTVFNLAEINSKKDWNIIMIISNKANGFESFNNSIERFYDDIKSVGLLNNANLFIIHGSYDGSNESNKGYYLTSNGKVEYADYGSQSFGDPHFFQQEIKDILNKYPSKHTKVSITSHGNGWSLSETPGDLPPELASLSRDDTTGSALDTHNFFKMFEGVEVDILNLASCFMGQIEVLHDIPRTVDYVLANSSYGYTAEDNVQKGLLGIINSRYVSPEEYGAIYVENYIERLSGNIGNPGVKTFYDMSELRRFFNYFENIVDNLKADLNTDPNFANTLREDIYSSHSKVQSYFRGGTKYSDVRGKDLMGFLRYLDDHAESDSTEVTPIQLMLARNSLGLATKEHRHTDYAHEANSSFDSLRFSYDNGYSPDDPGMKYELSYGASINFKEDSVLGYSYSNTWFAQRTGWDKIIEKVFND